MTRSIFDPTGGDTERSGSRFTPPDAQQHSNMPADVVDGVVEGSAEDDKTIVPAGLGNSATGQSVEDELTSAPESESDVQAPAPAQPIDDSATGRGAVE